MSERMKAPQIDSIPLVYRCRFHPTDWWHEVGCPHRSWTVEELQGALDNAKRSNEYITHVWVIKDWYARTAGDDDV